MDPTSTTPSRAGEAVDQLLRAKDPWDALDALVEDTLDGLIPCSKERWPDCSVEDRRRLTWLMEHLGRPAADAVLLEWLSSSDERDWLHLVHAVNSRRLKLPVVDAKRLLKAQDSDVVAKAVAAAGCSEAEELAPLIAVFLDREDIRMHAAIALGRLGARDFAPALLKRLPALQGLDHSGFVVGLELMGDPSIAGQLQKVLEKARGSQVWDLGHALWKLTGKDPVIDRPRFFNSQAKQIRKAWGGKIEKPGLPRIRDFRSLGSDVAEFVLEYGRCVIYVDYDPPLPGSAWPRWYRSLYVAGQPLYEVGSTCGTCETFLNLSGWQPRDASITADAIRNTLANVTTLSEEVLLLLAPLVHTLRSGRYLTALVDLDLERISEGNQDRSWWTRRTRMRTSEGAEPWGEEQRNPSWPNVEHFQLRERIPDSPASYGYLFPSQSLDTLDESTLRRYAESIADGDRPVAVALGWAEERAIFGKFVERSLVTILLDGHHKTASYCQLGIPTKTIILCRLEDTWGPAKNRGELFRKMIRSIQCASR